MTKRGYEQLKEELQHLETVERRKNVKEIEEARSHGDISENAEFHAAKERQSHLAGRIALLNDKIARAQIIDPPGDETPGRVKFGVTVVVEDSETGEEISYTIVGEDESDVALGRISITSPVARALMGKEVGDEASVKVPKGMRAFEILAIRYD
jgi:transcription elongation factor GreA